MKDALVLPRGRDESDDALQQLATTELECARGEQGEGDSGPGCSHCSRSTDEHPPSGRGEREARDRADVAAVEGVGEDEAIRVLRVGGYA